jgi:hypothetical protein
MDQRFKRNKINKYVLKNWNYVYLKTLHMELYNDRIKLKT